jgi:AbrB family looped-hinge helix DNA binding protein
MVTATITSKGQITIPKQVRASLHLQTGDRVVFLVQDPTCALLKPMTQSVDQMFGRLQVPAGKVQTVSGMNAAVARRMKGVRA